MSLTKVSIPANVADPFYRYQRDILQVVYESKNGGQTRLINIDSVSRQIKVPREELPKLFKKKLGVSINKDTIIGKIEVSQLEKILNTFIENKVICKKCRLPELTKDSCNACGVSIKSSKSVVRINDNKEDDDLEVEESDTEKRTVKIMYQLYEARTHFLPLEYINSSAQRIISHACKLLDRCWGCDDSIKLKQIKNEVKKLKLEIDEFDTHSIAPTQTSFVGVCIPEIMETVSKCDKIALPIMMLKQNKRAKENDMFQFPYGQGEMTCSEIKKQFPEFSVSMDGSDLGCYLLLYYELNPLNQRYEFRDADAEHDISIALGMDFDTISAGESKEDELSRKTEKLEID